MVLIRISGSLKGERNLHKRTDFPLLQRKELDNNPQKIQEVSRYSTRFWKDIEKKVKKDLVIPEQDPFRWAIEELRVSLFAQQLKTAYPVSSKRMDKAWDERS